MISMMKQPHPFHSNRFQQQRNWKRFIIYFILFFILYQGAKLLYKRIHANNTISDASNANDIHGSRNSSLYKKQNICITQKTMANTMIFLGTKPNTHVLSSNLIAR
ncbi:unnamed protein product [Mucor hiemalis]